MKGLILLLALLVSGCAQVSLTVYSDSSGASYTTTVRTDEGTRIVITRKSIIEKEEQNGTGD